VKFAGIVAQRGVNFIQTVEVVGVCCCRLTHCSQKVLCNNSLSCLGGCGGTQETNVPITYSSDMLGNIVGNVYSKEFRLSDDGLRLCVCTV
jgi:hypothetical protein